MEAKREDRTPGPTNISWTETDLERAREAAAAALPRIEPTSVARAFDAGVSVLEEAAAADGRTDPERREAARSAADARALLRWRAANGDEVPLPDGEDLVLWLLEERRRLLDAVSMVEQRSVRMPRGLSEGFAEAVGRAWNDAVPNGFAAAYDAVVAVSEPWRRQFRPVEAQAMPGDTDGHEDPEKSVAVVRQAYGWQIGTDGRLYGLVGGDMGYAATHVVVSADDIGLEGWKEEPSDRISLSAAIRFAEDEKDEWFRRMAALASVAADTVEDAREAGRAAGRHEAAEGWLRMLHGQRPDDEREPA